MTEDENTLDSGYVDVGDGHEIYYQQWGDPDGVPIFALHGGPVSQSADKHKLAFDPSKHLVVFHDQRGCGQSRAQDPFAHDTAETRVGDIEKLRGHFGYDSIQLFGFSWGSTLALYYALQHPERVSRMLIGAIYLARQSDNDAIFTNGAVTHAHPEAWDYYIETVPADKRNNPLAYYAEIFQNGSEAQKLDHLRRFNQLEPAGMKVDSDYAALRSSIDRNTLDLGTLEYAVRSINWFSNNCYIPENYLIENAAKLSDIPTVITHGRHDLVCRAQGAYDLAQAMGPAVHLHMTPGSHSESESTNREVQRAYAWAFLD